MDTKAKRQNLVLMNMRLAYKIAWGYFGCGIEQEELHMGRSDSLQRNRL